MLDQTLHGTWYAWYLRVYGVVAFSNILFEYTFAILYGRYMARQLRRSLLEEAEDPSKIPDEPIVALVPAFQEGIGPLRLCLEGLLHQEYDGPLLAVVVDDGSYLKDIELHEELIKNPPEVTLARGRRIVLTVAPYLRRYRSFQPPVVDYQAELDDLKAKRKAILDLCEGYAAKHPERFHFIASKQNQGKRRAHKTGHDWALAHFDGWLRTYHREWLEGWLERNPPPRHGKAKNKKITPWGYLTVDSDTILDPLATRNMVRALDREQAGAATGYVDIRNSNVNWLTRMVDWRYWSAFFVERAAQSWFGSLMCCSGPLSLYRGSILDDEDLGLMDLYVSQTFLGVLCTFGDDRRMTYLILRAGFKAIFVPEAHCLTDAPTTMGEYWRQQTRWNMSFYRELILSLREIFVWSVYLTYAMLMQLILPFALAGGVFITLWLVVFKQEYGMALEYVASVVGIGFFRSIYGAMKRTVPAATVENPRRERREWEYLFFAFYGFLYLWLLIVRARAIWKLLLQNDTRWQTRAAKPSLRVSK